MRLRHLPTAPRSRPWLHGRSPDTDCPQARRTDQDRSEGFSKACLAASLCDLTAVWVPDPVHEAIRDLVRARMDAVMQLMRARQQCLAFLLRHGRHYGPGKKNWTLRHRRWLATQLFEQTTHQIVFQDYVDRCGLPRIGATSSNPGSRRCSLSGQWHRWSKRCEPSAA